MTFDPKSQQNPSNQQKQGNPSAKQQKGQQPQQPMNSGKNNQWQQNRPQGGNTGGHQDPSAR